jgi:hypothetical protein
MVSSNKSVKSWGTRAQKTPLNFLDVAAAAASVPGRCSFKFLMGVFLGFHMIMDMAAFQSMMFSHQCGEDMLSGYGAHAAHGFGLRMESIGGRMDSIGGSDSDPDWPLVDQILGIPPRNSQNSGSSPLLDTLQFDHVDEESNGSGSLVEQGGTHLGSLSSHSGVDTEPSGDLGPESSFEPQESDANSGPSEQIQREVDAMLEIQRVFEKFLADNWNHLTYPGEEFEESDEDQVAQSIKNLDDRAKDQAVADLFGDDDFLAGLWDHFPTGALDNVADWDLEEGQILVRMGVREGEPNTLDANLRKLVFEGLQKLDFLQNVEANAADNARE